MKTRKLAILLIIMVFVASIFIGCNQKVETEPVVETDNNKIEDTKEVIPAIKIPVGEIYHIGNLEGIDEVASYLDKNSQDTLNTGISFDWSGREDVEDYKKAYFEEYIKLKNFYEKQYETYASSENVEEIKGFTLRKAFIEDLDDDGIPELILLIHHPVIEGEEDNALIYTYLPDEKKVQTIYRYTAGYYGMGDYGILLDMGFYNSNGENQLFIVESLDTFHTNETSISTLNKTYGEEEIEVSPAVKKITNTDFETGDIRDSFYYTSDIFERYLPTIKDPYASLAEIQGKELDGETYENLRNEIFGEDSIVFNNDRGIEDEYFFLGLDEQGNLIFENYDYLVLTEEELLEKLGNK